MLAALDKMLCCSFFAFILDESLCVSQDIFVRAGSKQHTLAYWLSPGHFLKVQHWQGHDIIPRGDRCQFLVPFNSITSFCTRKGAVLLKEALALLLHAWVCLEATNVKLLAIFVVFLGKDEKLPQRALSKKWYELVYFYNAF